MLWWVFGLILVFSIIANLFRPRKTFDNKENTVQEEERAKAQSWFGG
ncbi:MAG: hypothetical protein ACQEUT_16330 [Bacillota bacterium]